MIPERFGTDLVVGLSGGKDSLATCLHFNELGYSYQKVFADTGWEHPSTYEYLEYLESILGKIHRVSAHIDVKEEHQEFVQSIETELGFESPFIRYTLKYMCLPNPRRKFCTPRLKVDPITEFLNDVDDPINVVGIRHEESSKREKMSEWEWFDHFDCYTWRPIISWSFQDVADIHKRHDIKPNPLYLKGHARVGCYPCIYANKGDLKHLDDNRTKILHRLEEYLSDFRGKKVTMFKNMTIQQAVDWSKTSRGGKQYMLFNVEPPACQKWGMCGV